MFAPQTLGFTFPQALRYHIILDHKNALGIKIKRRLWGKLPPQSSRPRAVSLSGRLALSFPHLVRFL